MITPDAYTRDESPTDYSSVYEKNPELHKIGHDSYSHRYNACNWLKPLMDPKTRKALVAYCVERINDKAQRDTTVGRALAIAFTGLSGSIIAGPLATALEWHLYAVRKAGESRHSSQEVEGPDVCNSVGYIIVDDFVGSGRTVQRIAEQIFTHSAGRAKCVAIYCWRDDCFYTGAFLRGVLADEERIKERGGSLV